jgi:hypothetical protein
MYKLTDTIHVYERDDWDPGFGVRTMTWQARPAEAFIHHGAEGDAERVDTLAEQITAMRETRNFHFNVRGWSDIAYHYVIFQSYHKGVHARIFEGRPVRKVPAAQQDHNTGTFAVCIYGNFQHDDDLKPNTRYALEVLLTKRPDITGATALKTLGGHRDVVQTSCPGDTVYAALPTIAQAAGLKLYRH